MKHLRDFLVALGVFATLAFATGDIFAQTNQVRCVNLLDGETIQIFMGMQCPRGWAPT